MSRKKKKAGGNPANRPFKDGTAVGDAILGWAEDILLVGDDGQATIAAAVAAWVGSGDPGRRGINQCISACYQLQLILGAFGVESHIVPVSLRLLNPETGKAIGKAGTESPSFSNGALLWSGHAVLYLPEQGRILDATIGQALAQAPVKERIPLMGKVVGSMHGTRQQAARPGAIWQVGRNGHIAEYRVLDPSYAPLADPDIAAALNQATARLREKLPDLAQNMAEILATRNRMTMHQQ